MKKHFVIRFIQNGVLFCTIGLATSVRAQGTITFAGWADWSGPSYQELGMRYQLVIPPGTSGQDYMVVTAPIYLNHPENSSAYMLWYRQFNPYNYVSLSATNGGAFGLTSVELADPTAPSPSPVSISFIGHLPAGSTVTNTFTTPGSGADHLLNYQFTSTFASGLTSVDILAPRWAMDNLVFTVPEPSAASLLLLGSGVLTYVRQRYKQR